MFQLGENDTRAEFAVFAEDSKGPLWRMFAHDLDTARRKAQQFATDEGVEFFVYSFRDYSVVARFFPKQHKPTA